MASYRKYFRTQQGSSRDVGGEITFFVLSIFQFVLASKQTNGIDTELKAKE